MNATDPPAAEATSGKTESATGAAYTSTASESLEYVLYVELDPSTTSTAATATATKPREATDAPAAMSAPGAHRAMPRVDPVAIVKSLPP